MTIITVSPKFQVIPRDLRRQLDIQPGQKLRARIQGAANPSYRRDLREVFAYLVSGSHGPEFGRRLKERGVDGPAAGRT